MTDKELYEITRGVWKIGSDRKKAEYAFCVAKGIVQEIYRIQEWHSAGTAAYKTSAMKDANTKFKWKGRWEFSGKLAPDTQYAINTSEGRLLTTSIKAMLIRSTI